MVNKLVVVFDVSRQDIDGLFDTIDKTSIPDQNNQDIKMSKTEIKGNINNLNLQFNNLNNVQF